MEMICLFAGVGKSIEVELLPCLGNGDAQGKERKFRRVGAKVLTCHGFCFDA